MSFASKIRYLVDAPKSAQTGLCSGFPSGVSGVCGGRRDLAVRLGVKQPLSIMEKMDHSIPPHENIRCVGVLFFLECLDQRA